MNENCGGRGIEKERNFGRSRGRAVQREGGPGEGGTKQWGPKQVVPQIVLKCL